jgi:hypothetical protein
VEKLSRNSITLLLEKHYLSKTVAKPPTDVFTKYCMHARVYICVLCNVPRKGPAGGMGETGEEERRKHQTHNFTSQHDLTVFISNKGPCSYPEFGSLQSGPVISLYEVHNDKESYNFSCFSSLRRNAGWEEDFFFFFRMATWRAF